MLCLEVLLNGQRLARAGGIGVVALAVELGGGREGPIGLTVHGLPEENDRHLMWVNELIQSTAEVTFNVLEDSLADPDPPKLERLKPILAKRKELTITVDLNGQPQCRAQIGNLEFVDAHIEWCKAVGCFILTVKSVACTENGYGEKKEWWARRLGVGDCATVQVLSDIEG